jgi:hypothetical protein
MRGHGEGSTSESIKTMSNPGTAGNPMNDRPTVRLVDAGGAFVGHVSQREAARLLRANEAELVLERPPAVRLRTNSAPVNASRGQFLSARRSVLYGNFHFQGPDGRTMFHGDAEKALWYLNRDLVEVVSQGPPVLRFRFTPGGPGHIGDPFYLAGKLNRCVVCGSEEGLNRHHVVPSVYRRHLPTGVKEHAHHDVVLLCVGCHERYEREADQLRAELGRACGVPPHGLRGDQDHRRSRAVSLARALRRDGERIPPARRQEMLRTIGEWLGRWPVSDTDVETVAGLEAASEGTLLAEHGRAVVAWAGDVQAFLRRWREHFLQTMRPRFMPEHWDVNRPASE